MPYKYLETRRAHRHHVDTLVGYTRMSKHYMEEIIESDTITPDQIRLAHRIIAQLIDLHASLQERKREAGTPSIASRS